MVGCLFVSGCTSTKYSIKNEMTIGEFSSGVTQLNTNTYFIECSTYHDCSKLITEFSGNHTIETAFPYDGTSYGRTSGYFVITKDDL